MSYLCRKELVRRQSQFFRISSGAIPVGRAEKWLVGFERAAKLGRTNTSVTSSVHFWVWSMLELSLSLRHLLLCRFWTRQTFHHCRSHPLAVLKHAWFACVHVGGVARCDSASMAGNPPYAAVQREGPSRSPESSPRHIQDPGCSSRPFLASFLGILRDPGHYQTEVLRLAPGLMEQQARHFDFQDRSWACCTW